MANTYRISRNVEASLIDYIKTEFQADWNSDNVEKVFERMYGLEMPSICIRCLLTDHEWVELGSTSTRRRPMIAIDIFAESDGQRLDIKDWLIDKIKAGVTYYEYEIENGVVKTKVANGHIAVKSFTDTAIDYDIEKQKMDRHDRYRHRIDLTVSLGKVEA